MTELSWLSTRWRCDPSIRPCCKGLKNMDETKKETSGGVELTDELVEQLADEAERGYDISRLTRRRGRPPLGSAAAVLFQVRLDPALRGALAQRADEEQTTPSDVARRALQAYLHEE